MTPCGGHNPFSDTNADWNSRVFYVSGSVTIDDSHTINALGLRPVINIRSDVTINGSGTKDDPYTIS